MSLEFVGAEFGCPTDLVHVVEAILLVEAPVAVRVELGRSLKVEAVVVLVGNHIAALGGFSSGLPLCVNRADLRVSGGADLAQVAPIHIGVGINRCRRVLGRLDSSRTGNGQVEPTQHVGVRGGLHPQRSTPRGIGSTPRHRGSLIGDILLLRCRPDRNAWPCLSSDPLAGLDGVIHEELGKGLLEELLKGVHPSEVDPEAGIIPLVRLPLDLLSQHPDTQPAVHVVRIEHSGRPHGSRFQTGGGCVLAPIGLSVAPDRLHGESLNAKKLLPVAEQVQLHFPGPVVFWLIGQSAGNTSEVGLLGKPTDVQTTVGKRLMQPKPTPEATRSIPPFFYGGLSRGGDGRKNLPRKSIAGWD